MWICVEPECSSQQGLIQVLHTVKQMLACVWVIPQLQFNKGEPKCPLKHDGLMSSLRFYLKFTKYFYLDDIPAVSLVLCQRRRAAR